MVYIVTTSISVLFAYIAMHTSGLKEFDKSKQKVLTTIFIILSFIPLTFISAMRYDVGIDYFSYKYIYMGIADTKRYEVGFLLFNRILKQISSAPQTFFIISSIFICVIYISSIYKYSINPAFSILLFLINRDFTESFNTIRMYMAITITLLAIPYIKHKKIIPVLLITIIAMSFHISAIIIILLFILYFIDLTPAKGMIIAVAVFFFSSLIFNVTKWVVTSYTNREIYFEDNILRTRVNFSWTDFMIYLSFFILISCIYKRVKNNSNIKLVYAASLTGLIVALSGRIFAGTMIRMAYYMNPILAIFIPELIMNIPKKNLRSITKILIISFYSIVWIWVVFYQDNNLLPYRIASI